MSLEKRIKTIAAELHPLRDPNCNIKKLQDLALQAKLIKAFTKFVEGKRHEDAFNEITKVEDLIKETR
jgi:hypothetical protein